MQAWAEVALGAGAVAGTLGLATSGAAYASRWPTSQIFGRTLVDVPESAEDGRHTVVLTYDDGPSPRNTEALLDLLARHDARATFFLIGSHVRRFPEIARSVHAAGHTVGNHTEMHPDLARKSEVRIREEIGRCRETLEDLLGVEAKFFRPPYGSRRPTVLRVARSLNLVPVMWNVAANDWKPIGAETMLRRVERGLKHNWRRGRTSNVLLHDASHLDGPEVRSRADTLLVTAALLRRADLRFETVDAWVAADGDASADHAPVTPSI